MRPTATQLWRTNRFEVASLLLAVVLVVAAAMYFVGQLNELRPPLECLAGSGVVPAWCDQAFESQRPFFDARASSDLVMTALLGLPLVIGVVLGAPLVARDVERGTSQFVWTIGMSRRRWLIERMLLLGLLAAILLVILSIAGHALAAARDPDVDPFMSFTDFGARGPSVVARGLVVFALGALFGAVLGKVLPAVLSAAAVALVIILLARPAIFAAQPSALIGDNGTAGIRHAIVFDSAWQTPGGSVLTESEALTNVPPGTLDSYDWLSAHYKSVSVGVEGGRYTLIEAETALAGLIIVSVAVLTCMAVVSRRTVT